MRFLVQIPAVTIDFDYWNLEGVTKMGALRFITYKKGSAIAATFEPKIETA